MIRMANDAPLADLFPVTFVLNLPTREDRWEAFCERMETDWPFGKIVRFPAINGQLAPPPPWWTAGEGAWGCYRTHVQILETCLTNRVERVLVLEDDAYFVEGFLDSCQQFFQHLPSDWKMIYLGGQHLHQEYRLPRRVNDWVYKPFNINRAHCYALQGTETIREVYQHLNHSTIWKKEHHVDHHLGEWHERQTDGVYVPRIWLAGQFGGLSSITCKEEQRNLWEGAEALVSGPVDRPMVGVLGVYRGGTSCIAGVLHHLGLELGSHTKDADEDNPAGYFEDIQLGQICRNIFREPWLVRESDEENATNLLRCWASKRCRELEAEGVPLCGKHPILSLLVPELEVAWNHPKFVVVDRSLDDVTASIRRVGWGWPIEAIEYAIPKITKLRDESLARLQSDFLRIDFNDLVKSPELVVPEIAKFLDCNPNENQLEQAINFVRREVVSS